MTAQRLRDAARGMREKAEASQTAYGYAPWRVDGLDEHGQYVVVPVAQLGLGGRVAADLTEEDAEHVAAWHPAVALAAADLLDSVANDIDAQSAIHNLTSTTVARASALADAFLGQTTVTR